MHSAIFSRRVGFRCHPHHPRLHHLPFASLVSTSQAGVWPMGISDCPRHRCGKLHHTHRTLLDRMHCQFYNCRHYGCIRRQSQLRPLGSRRYNGPQLNQLVNEVAP